MQLLCVVDSDVFIWADKKKGFTTAAPTEAWESKAKPTCPSLSYAQSGKLFSSRSPSSANPQQELQITGTYVEE